MKFGCDGKQFFQYRLTAGIMVKGSESLLIAKIEAIITFVGNIGSWFKLKPKILLCGSTPKTANV